MVARTSRIAVSPGHVAIDVPARAREPERIPVSQPPLAPILPFLAPMTPEGIHIQTDLFAGPGEIRRLARELDWTRTPLGAVDSWPAALRAAVRIALDSPFPINLWCGPELVLVYNDAYREIMGSKHPRGLGRSGREVWSEIWSIVQPMFESIQQGGPAIYADDAPFVIERADPAGITSAPGEPNAWFTFGLSPVRDESGDIVAYFNIVSESTRRLLAERATIAARERAERAEARLREVFAGAPAFMAVLRGADHVFEYVNDAYYQLVGHRELVGRPVWEALPEVRGQGFEELLEGVLETGDAYIGREVPVSVLRTPDSEPELRYIDLVYYPITEADGTRTGIVAHGSDVTAHVLARNEALRARAEAEKANLAKSHFLAMMSHEIRTPINAIVGYSDLLDSGVAGELSAQQREYLDRVRASSQHLLGLVNDVLDLAKIEAEEMTVSSVQNEIGPVIQAALDIIAPAAATKGVRLQQRMECAGTLCYEGDDVRVRQILLNLLSNALKFTEDGGSIDVVCATPEVAAQESALTGSGPWLVVTVRDTGAGIPDDQLERIFEPFVQAEGGLARRAAGTGLGLTISRRLARMMGGDLLVSSELGAGSSFALWLKRA